LSGVLSGPLDADKLDYMARDSHHAGLPVGIDVKRSISRLQVVTVTPPNAPNESVRKRARAMPNERPHELGISIERRPYCSRGSRTGSRWKICRTEAVSGPFERGALSFGVGASDDGVI
jgi:hypothetical protein